MHIPGVNDEPVCFVDKAGSRDFQTMNNKKEVINAAFSKRVKTVLESVEFPKKYL